MKLTNPSELKSIITKHGFSFSKGLGQNFLIDKNILDKILNSSNINENLGVLEIGPGAGTLTRELAKNSKKVIAVEIDKKLMPVLEDTLCEFKNVKVINDDILDVDLKTLFSQEFDDISVAVVANLPYYITTPIIMKFLEEKIPIISLTIMVQKEVAERMVAKAGSKEYGALSVAVQYYSKPEIICRADPHCFMPQPKVESLVAKLNVLGKPMVEVKDEKLFFSVVKSAFGQRRKTFLNSISNSPYINVEKTTVLGIIKEMGLDPNIRGERLTIEQFAQVSNAIGN